MEKDPKAVAFATCRRWLRPLVRLLIRSGVSWKEFADVAKTAFVEVATADFGIRGRPTNIARVAVLTGINRREVARQREAIATAALPEPAYLNAAQRVLSAWHQDIDFLDSRGAPLELPFAGELPSFTALCARHAGDMPPTVLIKELRNVGAVTNSREGPLRVLSRNYIPARVDPNKVLRAGSVLEDLGTTVVHDLICPPEVSLRFERRAENDRIDKRHLPAFREFLEREGQAFLERVDDWLTRHEAAPDLAGSRDVVRLGVGAYHIQTDQVHAQTHEGSNHV